MIEDRVQLTVAENGVVTGSLNIMFIGNDSILDDCTAHWNIEIKGDFEGRLTGPSGEIGITEIWTNTPVSTCESSPPYEVRFPRQIEIEVYEDQMVGSAIPIEDDNVDLAWTFTASKE